jgi:predicted ATP-grasp superfamily ATP-dependent carboligase
VPMAVSLGALLADVPHTRPVHVIGTASDGDVIDRFDLQPSRYEGPTGIVGVLSDTLGRAGVASASLWAAVPGYAPQIPSPKAALALVERACALLGAPAPIEALRLAAADYDDRIAALIAEDDDLQEYVNRLESMTDDDGPGAFLDDDDEDEADDAALEAEVDPGELVAEVERFLRDRDSDG